MKMFEAAEFPETLNSLDEIHRFIDDSAKSAQRGVGFGIGLMITDYQDNQAYYEPHAYNGSWLKTYPEGKLY